MSPRLRRISIRTCTCAWSHQSRARHRREVSSVFLHESFPRWTSSRSRARLASGQCPPRPPSLFSPLHPLLWCTRGRVTTRLLYRDLHCQTALNHGGSNVSLPGGVCRTLDRFADLRELSPANQAKGGIALARHLRGHSGIPQRNSASHHNTKTLRRNSVPYSAAQRHKQHTQHNKPRPRTVPL